MQNKFNTPFKELYPTFQDYQKHEAQQRLELGEKYFLESANKHIDLLAMSDYDIKLYHLEDEKEKAIQNRAYLNKCVNGDVNDPLYLQYYNYLYQH